VDSIRHLIGDAGDDHAAIAVTNQDDVPQVNLLKLVDNRFDRC
jgi:hypothetical protein